MINAVLFADSGADETCTGRLRGAVRWKHEANQAAAPAFVAVRITDANAPLIRL